MDKSIVYLIFFTVYTFFLLFIGKSGFKRTETRRDFYLASGSLGIRISVFTFVATWLSAASLQGFTGAVYYYGYTPILYAVFPWFFGAFIMLFLVKKLRAYNVLTLPQFFSKRYKSRNLQIISAIIIILIYTLYIIIQIRGFGIVMSQLLGISYNISIFLVYLFIVYTTFGGLFSVAKSDGMNFFLIVFGTLISVYLIIRKVGGINEIFSSTYEYKNIFGDFSVNSNKSSVFHGMSYYITVLSGFFGWGLGLAANPQYIVRICSAKDDKTAYKMIGYSLAVLLVIYVFLVIIGIGGRSVLTSSVDNSPDAFFPNLINGILYSPFSGLILISIVASAISTANSQLLIVASSCCNDIYENISKKKVSEETFINFNRIVIVIFGSISLFLAINPPDSLLIYGNYLWGFFTATFFVPLYGGLFFKTGNKYGVYGSILGGGLTFIIFKEIAASRGITINPGLPSFIISLILYILISIYKRDKAEGDKTCESVYPL